MCTLKKLLLLALIPSLSFACIDEQNVAIKSKVAKVGDHIHLYADFYFSVTNHTGKAQEYRYNFQLCPQKQKCEVFASNMLVNPHSSRTKIHRLNGWVKYKHPGKYTLTAKIDVKKHPNEHMQSDFQDTIKVIK